MSKILLILLVLAAACGNPTGIPDDIPPGYRLYCFRAHADTSMVAMSANGDSARVIIAYPDYCQWRPVK